MIVALLKAGADVKAQDAGPYRTDDATARSPTSMRRDKEGRTPLIAAPDRTRLGNHQRPPEGQAQH